MIRPIVLPLLIILLALGLPAYASPAKALETEEESFVVLLKPKPGISAETVMGMLKGVAEPARGTPLVGELREGLILVKVNRSGLEEVLSLGPVDIVAVKSIPTPALVYPREINITSVKEPNNFFIRDVVLNVPPVETMGVNGTGILVADVDTGVDYGHPDIAPTLAYVIGLNNGNELVVDMVSENATHVLYTDLFGNPGAVPKTDVAYVEPLVLDADESHVVLMVPVTPVGGQIDEQLVTILIPFTVTVPSSFFTGCITYNVAGIPSASGVYRFGVTFLLGVPFSVIGSDLGILMYDPTTPGVYDRLRIDFNQNCDFTDDAEISYYGNRIATYDIPPADGIPDYSLSVVGGFFYDIAGWFGVPRIYRGWDLNGRYLSIFYDFNGHGTAVASAIAGRGTLTGLPGVAVGAKVVGVKALWVGNTEIGMLWAAGFDVDEDGDVLYTGKKRTHIISNSWGISYFQLFPYGIAYDVMSMFVNGLVQPGFLDPAYPGIVVVHAGGNGGYGFGTITSPGAAFGAITTGAATSGHFWWYALGAYAPIFRYGDMIPWSLRGPTAPGYNKPDVANIGAFGLTAAPVGEYVTIFGGTSYATPLTSGVAALVLDAFRRNGIDPATVNPWTVKAILTSSAVDNGYTPFTAGHGLVNAYRAVNLTLGLAGWTNVKGPLMYYSVDAARAGIASVMSDSWIRNWGLGIPTLFMTWYSNTLALERPYMRAPPFYTDLYMPGLRPGSGRAMRLTVRNPYSMPATVSIEPYTLRPVYRARTTLSLATPGRYYFTMGQLGFDKAAILGGDLVVFRASFPYTYLDVNNNYFEELWFGLRFFDWIDDDGQNDVDLNEIVFYNYDVRPSNVLELPVARVGQRIRPGAEPLLRVDFLFGSGATVPVTVEVVVFKRVPASDVSVAPRSFLVRPNDDRTVIVRVRAGRDYAPTVHERFLLVNATVGGASYVSLIPLTFTVVKYVTPLALQRGVDMNDGVSDPWYNASVLRGATDWAWRYESGDWRFYYLALPRMRNVEALNVTAMWTFTNSSLVIYVLNDVGAFAGRFVGQGVSPHIYLGSGTFTISYTGMPGRHVVFAPIAHAIPPLWLPAFTSTTGLSIGPNPERAFLPYLAGPRHVYTLVVRQAVYGGDDVEEPIDVAVSSVRGGAMPTRLFVTNPFLVRQLTYNFFLPFDAGVESRVIPLGGLFVPDDYEALGTVPAGPVPIDVLVFPTRPFLDALLFAVPTDPMYRSYQLFGGAALPLSDTYIFEWVTLGLFRR